jgi:hypothetical protein
VRFDASLLDKKPLELRVQNCRHRTSLRSGTIMQSSSLPFLIWYKTMFLMSVTKKAFLPEKFKNSLA